MKNFVPLIVLCLALMLPMASAQAVPMSSDYDIMPLDTSQGVYVKAFSNDGTTFYDTAFKTISSGSGSTKTTNTAGDLGGYVLRIPASSVDGYYIVSGLTPIYSTSNYNLSPSYYLSRNTSEILSHALSNTSFYPTFYGIIFIPAHTSYLYLYVYVSIRSGQFGYYYNSPSLYFYPSSSMSTDYTSLLNQIISGETSIQSAISQLQQSNTSGFNKIESALSKIEQATTQLSPMGQFESDYLQNFESQLNGVEDALLGQGNSSLSGLAPEGGDFVGFATDISDGFGFSGSAFNPSQLADAVNGLSGTDAFGVGGPWEFFSQSTADSLAGNSGVNTLLNRPPDYEIYLWILEAEKRRSSW